MVKLTSRVVNTYYAGLCLGKVTLRLQTSSYLVKETFFKCQLCLSLTISPAARRQWCYMHWFTAIRCHQRCKSMPGRAFINIFPLEQLNSLCFCFSFSQTQETFVLFLLRLEYCYNLFLFVISQAPIYVNKAIVLEDAIRIGYGGRPHNTKPIFNIILDRFLVCLWISWVSYSVTVANHMVGVLVQRSWGTRSFIGRA